MSWEREILSTSAEDLVDRNSPTLLASQLQAACQKVLDLYADHNEEMERVKAQLSEAERIGVEVQWLRIRGRKSVRISDLGTVVH